MRSSCSSAGQGRKVPCCRAHILLAACLAESAAATETAASSTALDWQAAVVAPTKTVLEPLAEALAAIGAAARAGPAAASDARQQCGGGAGVVPLPLRRQQLAITAVGSLLAASRAARGAAAAQPVDGSLNDADGAADQTLSGRASTLAAEAAAAEIAAAATAQIVPQLLSVLQSLLQALPHRPPPPPVQQETSSGFAMPIPAAGGMASGGPAFGGVSMPQRFVASPPQLQFGSFGALPPVLQPGNWQQPGAGLPRTPPSARAPGDALNDCRAPAAALPGAVLSSTVCRQPFYINLTHLLTQPAG